MLGAIIGDIAGSRFEFHNRRSKEFTLLHPKCYFTDDSVMSLAVCQALLRTAPDFQNLDKEAVACMREIGQLYPNCGYGGHFGMWVFLPDPKPYHSYGNGAAMRVSGCGWAARSLEEAKRLSEAVTAVTHDHPEGLKGAESTATAIWLARSGKSKEEIRVYITENYYPIDFTLDGIRRTYRFHETCQDSVPQAFEAFFESADFEDTIRNAVSIGGDSDTIAAIAGSVAEAYYGIPAGLREQAAAYLDERLSEILTAFESKFPPKIAK